MRPRHSRRSNYCSNGRANLRKNGKPMPKYGIERELPGAGQLTPERLKGISQTSSQGLQALGPQIQWVQSFVTDDKIYCVYIAPNKQLVEEHARQGGFPANRINEVRSTIDPTTAEQTPR